MINFTWIFKGVSSFSISSFVFSCVLSLLSNTGFLFCLPEDDLPQILKDWSGRGRCYNISDTRLLWDAYWHLCRYHCLMWKHTSLQKPAKRVHTHTTQKKNPESFPGMRSNRNSFTCRFSSTESISLVKTRCKYWLLCDEGLCTSLRCWALSPSAKHLLWVILWPQSHRT